MKIGILDHTKLVLHIQQEIGIKNQILLMSEKDKTFSQAH